MIALLLTVPPPISVAAVRTVNFVNAADDINLTDVFGISRRFLAVDKGWTVKETRQFRYSLVGTERIPGQFKPIVTEYRLPLAPRPATFADEFPPALDDRIARIYSALVMQRNALYPAELGGLGQGSVEFLPTPGRKFKFRYREFKFDATGEGDWDFITNLPRRWSLAAKDVAIPGGDGRADLTLSEVPETQ